MQATGLDGSPRPQSGPSPIGQCSGSLL